MGGDGYMAYYGESIIEAGTPPANPEVPQFKDSHQ